MSPCAFTQAAWTANANGASGTPTWHVQTNAFGGDVSLSCTTCTNTVATATSPSYGCVYDINVYVTYPDGSQSSNLSVFINEPASLALQSGWPADALRSPSGYYSYYYWTMQDSCTNSISNVDANEAYGTFSPDTANNWTYPMPNEGYITTSTIGDVISALFTSPYSPLTSYGTGSTQKVYHDTPWNLYIGAQTPRGTGVSIQSDTQQWYVDHGKHQ